MSDRDQEPIAKYMQSSDSSFYGDETTKADYKAQDEPNVSQIRSYWNSRKRCIQWLAVQKRTAAKIGPRSTIDEPKAKKVRRDEASLSQTVKAQSNVPRTDDRLEPPPSPFNPHEGDEMAKQLDESIEAFLSRLIPSSAQKSQQPFIFINYPLSKQSPDGNISEFKTEGRLLLDGYLHQRGRVAEQNPEKSAISITRMMKTARVALEEDLLRLARAKGILRGKWMLFVDPSQIDRVWASVARAVDSGELGVSAKVGAGEVNGGSQLICVYTRDFGDRDEILRAVQKLMQMGLVKTPIYYKCDAYTYLDVKNGNPYGLKAAMYRSNDMMEK